jgi:hypothetical protein
MVKIVRFSGARISQKLKKVNSTKKKNNWKKKKKKKKKKIDIP